MDFQAIGNRSRWKRWHRTSRSWRVLYHDRQESWEKDQASMKDVRLVGGPLFSIIPTFCLVTNRDCSRYPLLPRSETTIQPKSYEEENDVKGKQPTRSLSSPGCKKSPKKRHNHSPYIHKNRERLRVHLVLIRVHPILLRVHPILLGVHPPLNRLSARTEH